ncbi:MAG: aminotransferase class III-fold pyridoxal phosphate-dependent enzyme [Acidobacteria bacterium]|nr:aminotransferase class III-fold pyridoxal phosphate-dependent enzyme [Acidobacteriota bacterium]
MDIYSTNINKDEKDQASFIHPFTQQQYYRGRLNVRVDRDEILGPLAHEVMGNQIAHIPPTTHPDFPAILDPTHMAFGPFISGLGDNLFFDAVLNVGTHAVFGYNHPRILQKLQRLGQIIPGFIGAGTDFFFTSRYGAPAAQDLAELLNQFAREAYDTEFMTNFGNSGAEANENASKIAMYSKFRQIRSRLGERSYAQMCEQLGLARLRPGVDELWSNYPFFAVSFHGAFHGRTGTTNALSMSKLAQKEGYQVVPYVLHLPYDSTVAFERHIDITPLETLIANSQLRRVVDERKIPIDLLSIIIMEPIQGEGGYIIPEAGLLQKLNDFLDKYRDKGVCFISDEVQAGLFRTGEFSGMQNWYRQYPNLKPDILTFAKPLHVGAAVAQKRWLENWPGGKFSGTWSEGNLLAIAMATYSLEELKQIDPTLQRPYPEHAKKSGEYLRQRLADLAQHFASRYPGLDLISNVRGIGQMNAFNVPSKEFQRAVVYQAFRHGMHLLGTGERAVRIFGTVDQRQREADILVQILHDALQAVVDQFQRQASGGGTGV